MKPRYTHDCAKCTYQGSHGKFDVYRCKSTFHDTDNLIARYSSDGPDYSSMMRSSFGRLVMAHVMTSVGNYPVTEGEEQKLPDWVEAIVTVMFFQKAPETECLVAPKCGECGSEHHPALTCPERIRV